MDKSVVETHQQLYHYTTAAGLQGIVESQQLWATNIAYLNDAEEHTGYFDRRLPHLLADTIRAAIAEVASTASGQRHIDSIGDIEKVVEDLKRIIPTSIRSVTLKHNNPYVTSFCRALPRQHSDDGLLSQWRGYGLDGGYAIIFEANKLQQLLDEEKKNFHYQFGVWGDVEYYNQDASQKAAHPETLKQEAIIQEAIGKIILTQDFDAFDPPFYNAITALSCMHKYRRFEEEAEVRIVALPSNTELFELGKNSGVMRQKKPVEFKMKNGILMPYIKLFGRQSNGNEAKLPISKVIVGPHPDKLKRQKAVKLMFERYGIEADVAVSDIPYLGR